MAQIDSQSAIGNLQDVGAVRKGTGAIGWLWHYDLVITAALGPAFIFPGVYSLPGLALMAALRLGRWQAGQCAPRSLLVKISTWVLLAMLPVSLWASADRTLSWPMFFRLAWGLALFLAVIDSVRTSRQAQLLTIVLLAGVALIGAVSLVGTDWIRAKVVSLPVYSLLPAVITDASRFPGGAFHPNVIAGTLAPFIPLALALSMIVDDRPRTTDHRQSSIVHRPWSMVAIRVVLWILAAGLTGIVLLTQSRGAWLALGAGMLAFLFLASRRAWRRALVLTGAVALLLALIVVAVSLGPGLLQPIQAGSQASGSSVSRPEVWSRALVMIRDTPFTGIGLGTFPVILDAFYPSFLGGPEARIPHAHNLLLQAAVDLGVPGALAFLALLVASIAAAWRTVHSRARRSFAWCLGLGLVSGLLVLAVHGAVDAAPWAARSVALMWLLLALGLALGRLDRC